MRKYFAILFLALSLALAHAQVGPLPGAGPFLTKIGSAIGIPVRFMNASSTGTLSSLSSNIGGGGISTGDLVVLCVYTNTTGTITSVSDGANTYVQINTVTYSGNSKVTLFYVANATAVAAATALTVNFSATSTGGGMEGAKVSSGIATSPLDVNATGSAAALTVTVNTGVLGQAKEIIFGCGSAIASTGTLAYTNSGSFNNIANLVNAPNNFGMTLDYNIVNSTSSVGYTPTFSGGTGTVGTGGSVASFKGKP